MGATRQILFTPGPVMMYPNVIAASAVQTPYFRNIWFSDLLKRLETSLLELVSAPSGSRAVFLTGSGTAAMEAAVVNFVPAGSRPAVIDGGAFGHRFIEILQRHGHKVQEAIVDRDPLTDLKALSRLAYETTALFVTGHETSLGHCYDLAATANFCRSTGALHIVDAISLFATDPVDMTANDIDVAILSSNKGLALAPGISMLIMSPRALERRVPNPPTYYLDAGPMLADGARGQTVFTPAISTLMQMSERFSMLRGAGLERSIAHAADLAQYFRSSMSGMPLTDYTTSRPNAMTTLELTSSAVSARELVARLADEFGLVVAPPTRSRTGVTFLRIGHMGNLIRSDVDLLVAALFEIIKTDLSVRVNAAE